MFEGAPWTMLTLYDMAAASNGLPYHNQLSANRNILSVLAQLSMVEVCTAHSYVLTT